MDSSPNHPLHVALALAGFGVAALIAAAALVWARIFGVFAGRGLAGRAGGRAPERRGRRPAASTVLGHRQAEGTNGASPYGCCLLAMTGHQVRLPESWPGGDRLAVHATNDLSSIGRPASFGCLRTDSSRARWLIETIPLGAPTFIRS